MRRLLMAIMCWPLAAFAAGPNDPALDDLTRCMRGNIPQTVRIQSVEITTWDRAEGSRKLKGKLYGTREKDRARVMMRIDGVEAGGNTGIFEPGHRQRRAVVVNHHAIRDEPSGKSGDQRINMHDQRGKLHVEVRGVTRRQDLVPLRAPFSGEPILVDQQ